MDSRKRRLNTLAGCSRKRMHMEQSSSFDNDDNMHDDDDDQGGCSSHMSDYDDGKSNYSDVGSVGQDSNLSKLRMHSDPNDASFDSTFSAYLQEKSSTNLSQSLSNMIDAHNLNVTKDNFFEKSSNVSGFGFLASFNILFDHLFVHCPVQIH